MIGQKTMQLIDDVILEKTQELEDLLVTSDDKEKALVIVQELSKLYAAKRSLTEGMMYEK